MKKKANKHAIQQIYLQQTECSGKRGVKTQLRNCFPTLSVQVNDIPFCIRCREGLEDQECRFIGEIISSFFFASLVHNANNVAEFRQFEVIDDKIIVSFPKSPLILPDESFLPPVWNRNLRSDDPCALLMLRVCPPSVPFPMHSFIVYYRLSLDSCWFLNYAWSSSTNPRKILLGATVIQIQKTLAASCLVFHVINLLIRLLTDFCWVSFMSASWMCVHCGLESCNECYNDLCGPQV